MADGSLRHLLLAGTVLVAGLLAGCGEEEQRPLHFEKGKYTGPQDAPLSAERIDSLKQRLNNGRF